MHDAVALPPPPAVAASVAVVEAVLAGALDEELQATSSRQAMGSRKANR
jgi:hypothetical protein